MLQKSYYMHFKAENLQIPKHPWLLFLTQNLKVLQPPKQRSIFSGTPCIVHSLIAELLEKYRLQRRSLRHFVQQVHITAFILFLIMPCLFIFSFSAGFRRPEWGHWGMSDQPGPLWTISGRGEKKPSGGLEYLINTPLPNFDRHSGDKIPCPIFFVKLWSRSRSGESHVRVRWRSGEGHNSKDKIHLSWTLMQVKLVKLPFCFGRACLYT